MKKFISLSIGIALLASPIIASAQTTSASDASIIAILEQLVATLTQELQQLLAARAGSTQSSPALLTATPTSGSAPLTVEFHINPGMASASSIDFGDDKTNVETLGNSPGNSCGDPNESECGHTYTTPGTYTAHIYDIKSEVLGTVTITVTGSNSTQSSATIDQSSLTTGSANPTITGSTTAGPATFLVSIKNSSGSTVYSSAPPINNGHWSVVSPALAAGTYQVIVYGGGGGNILATGTLTVNAAQSSAPISCAFNGQTITSGNSITAYQAPSVPSGQQCASQQRTCANGILSGSYANTSCVVAASTNVSVTSYPNFNNLCYGFVTGYANSTNVISGYNDTCTNLQKSMPFVYSVTQEVNGSHVGAANDSLGRSTYMNDYDYASDYGQWIKANFYPSAGTMIYGAALDTINYSKTNVTGWPLQKGTLFFGLNDTSVSNANVHLDKNVVVEFDMRIRGDEVNNTMNPGTYSGHRIMVGMLLNWSEQSRSNKAHYFEVNLSQTPGYSQVWSGPDLPLCHDTNYDRCWYDPSGTWSEVRYVPYAAVAGGSLNFVTDQWVHVRIPLSYAKSLGWVSVPTSWSDATLGGLYIGMESTGATRYWTEVKNYQVYYTQ
jgi:hypothetical protein